VSVLVVDASVALKWFVREDDADAALRVLDERHRLHAPDFLLLEVDSVLCNWVRRKIISLSESDEIREGLRSFPIQMHAFTELLDSAYVIATETGATVYDCLYVALAVLLKGTVVTADLKLCETLAAGRFAEHVTSVDQLG